MLAGGNERGGVLCWGVKADRRVVGVLAANRKRQRMYRERWRNCEQLEKSDGQSRITTDNERQRTNADNEQETNNENSRHAMENDEQLMKNVRHMTKNDEKLRIHYKNSENNEKILNMLFCIVYSSVFRSVSVVFHCFP